MCPSILEQFFRKMFNHPNDIFASYDCAVNDKGQVRFVEILKEIRNTFLDSKYSSLHQEGETGFPKPELYATAISALLVQKLELIKNKTVAGEQISDFFGIPECYKILYISLQSVSQYDSSISLQILKMSLPLFKQENEALLKELCPAVASLSRRAKLDDTETSLLIDGLCSSALSSRSTVRNSAAKAIYDNRNLHTRCYTHLFKIIDSNPLGSLTVLYNITSSLYKMDLTSYYNIVVDYMKNPKVDVRVKAIKLMGFLVHHVLPETVSELIKFININKPSVPGEELTALTELIQSCASRLRKEDPLVLVDTISDILDIFRFCLSLEDKESEVNVKNSISYICTALIDYSIKNGNNFTVLAPLVDHLHQSLAPLYQNTWVSVYNFLSIFPPLLKEHTFEVVRDPLFSSISKVMSDPTSFYVQPALGFIVSCMNEMGLKNFSEQTELSGLLSSIKEYTKIEEFELFEKVILPMFAKYEAKHTDDLYFTYHMLLPIENVLFNILVNGVRYPIWWQLWNSLPSCVTTDDVNASIFMVDHCLTRLEQVSEKGLIKPISHIFSKLAKYVSDEKRLECLKAIQFFASHSDCFNSVSHSIPGICPFFNDKKLLNDYFNKELGNILNLLKEEKNLESGSLLDLLALVLPFVSDENRKNYYQLINVLITQKTPLTKKSLKVLDNTVKKKIDLDILIPYISNALQASLEANSSSSVRYRIRLMNLMMKYNSEYIPTYLVEVIPALKSPGSKAREAAEECLIDICSHVSSKEEIINPIISLLKQDNPSLISAGIDGYNIILKKFFQKFSDEEIYNSFSTILTAGSSREESEVIKSTLDFVRLFMKLSVRVTRKVGDSENATRRDAFLLNLGNVIQFLVNAKSKKNWKIQNDAHNLIKDSIYYFGIDDVTKVFPQDSLPVLRNIRKEYSRDQRNTGDDSKYRTSEGKIEFDSKFDEGEANMLDPGAIISRRYDDDNDSDIEFDANGRIIMKESTFVSKRKIASSFEDDLLGNELDEYISKHSARRRAEREQARKDLIKDEEKIFGAIAHQANHVKHKNEPNSRMSRLKSKNTPKNQARK